MVEALSKAIFASLANSSTLKKVASRLGMRQHHAFARRFVAGEALDEAVACARRIEQRGLTVTLDHLGERVSSREAATAATKDYMRIVEAAAAAGISRNVSVKLTQLGLDIDKATGIDNIRRVLDVAGKSDFFVRIDMENSAYTQLTFEVLEAVWSIGWRNVGVAIQSALFRSPQDVKHMNEMGVRVRLVKGAYREPKDVAYREKEDVDTAYIRLMESLLTEGTYPAIATHDPRMIDHAKAFARERGLDKNAFEFQMLFGIRRDLQRSLIAEGYRMRIYVPFGTEWYPYFMRRLGERPANLGFVLKSLIREQPE